jgi:hypothetical protein
MRKPGRKIRLGGESSLLLHDIENLKHGFDRGASVPTIRGMLRKLPSMSLLLEEIEGMTLP